MRRLTTALLSLALVPAAVVLPTVSAPAATPHPVSPSRSSVPLTPLTTAARTTATAGAVAGLTPVVRTAELSSDPFDLVGVTWDSGTAPAGMVVQVRVRQDGAWSGWQSLPAMDEAPDPATAEGARAASFARQGTEPFTTEHADGVQVRIDSPTGAAPRHLTAELIDGGRSDADEAAAPAGAAQAGAPTVITRAQWGADESLRNGSLSYNRTVKALVLHHTAGSNSYSAAGAAAQLRSTYAYHTGMGWSDIGYNIVIDRYGRIYEGRKGSITSMVVGAHAGGFNTNTFGFSVMGNFDVAAPPAAVLTAVKTAMAWKAHEFGINPSATTSLTSSGGGTSRYAAGQVVTKPTIMGHRDVGLTACPGKYLYSSMAAIRSHIARSTTPTPPPALTAVSLSPTALDYAGGTVTLTAKAAQAHSWTMRVSSLCSGVVRTLTGTAAPGTVTARWGLRNDAGQYVPPGIYTVEATFVPSQGKTQVLRKDVEVLTTATSAAPACSTLRLSGSDRYTTSVIVGKTAFPAATSAVLVSGNAQVDGVVAAPFAFAKRSPLLLTPKAALPPSVSAELTRRHVTQVWLIGGEGVIAPSVVTQLRATGITVTRLAGATRYATARAVALAMPASTGAILASGSDANLIDAVAVGGAAARSGRPILLTAPAKLPAETRDALARRRPAGVNIMGSREIISDKVVAELLALGIGSRVRLGGVDRYATAAAAATAYAKLVGKSEIVVAPGSGASIVDALISGQLGRVTLLSAAAALPAATQSWLTSTDPAKVTVVGGPDRVSTAAMRSIAGTVG